MMRSATLLGLLVLILGFAGCGGDGALRGEAEMKEVIAAGIRADEVLYNPGFSKEKGEAGSTIFALLERNLRISS